MNTITFTDSAEPVQAVSVSEFNLNSVSALPVTLRDVLKTAIKNVSEQTALVVAAFSDMNAAAADVAAIDQPTGPALASLRRRRVNYADACKAYVRTVDQALADMKRIDPEREARAHNAAIRAGGGITVQQVDVELAMALHYELGLAIAYSGAIVEINTARLLSGLTL